MTTSTDRPRQWASLAGATAASAGAAVLLGWTLDWTTLTSLIPGWQKMAALTALLMAMAGLSLWCSAAEAREPTGYSKAGSAGFLSWRWLGSICAAIVLLVATLRLSAYAFGWDWRMDVLWFYEPAGAAIPTRMAPASALNFMLLSAALLLARRRSSAVAFQSLVIIAGLLAWVGFSHYFYGGAPLHSMTSMSAHASVAFLVLSSGIACLRADVGLVALMQSDSEGGVIARRLVPSALIVPMVMGWLRLRAQDAGWFGTEAGVSVFALSNIVVFGALVWASAAQLHRSDRKRNRAETALRDGEERFRTLTESLPHLVWTCRADGWCDYLSPQWVEYTGRPAAEQLGSGWADHLHPEDRERVRTEWMRATQRGNLFDIEFRIRRADGVYRWFRTRAVPLRDQSGAIVKWFGSNTDYDDSKHAQERLRTQLERLDLLNRITRAIGERQDLRSIFQVVVGSLEDNLPLDFGCICVHHELRALTVASVGAKSKALAAELNMSEHSRIAVDDNGLSRCMLGELVYEANMAATQVPFTQWLARHGLHSLVAAPLLVENHVFGVLLAARREANSFSVLDCEFLRQLSEHVALASHQTQIHSALQEAYDELRRTQEAVMQQERLRVLGQMASGIAHDVNNAISPVVLYTQSLLEKEPNLSARSRKYLEVIERSVHDVAATVARMREFYRHREPQLAPTPVNLNNLVQQVVDLTRARWSDMALQRGVVIQMRTEAAADLPAIMGVESEIREALTNLVFNAVDAMPDGGVLLVRTREAQDASSSAAAPPKIAILEVIDTGAGMNEETRRHCLEPFFSTKGERGTGLGLAMVYGVMRRHSAEIEIDSAVGRGTTMRLIFPVPKKTATDNAQDVASNAMPGPLRVLVVDDDPLLLMSLKDILEGDGHSVETADGGQAGIDIFLAAQSDNERLFAVVITDLGMPHIDGRRVAHGIKQISPSTPVILLTGWGQRIISEGETPPGVDLVLSKPPKLRELREALATIAPAVPAGPGLPKIHAPLNRYYGAQSRPH
jgi:PAS domain S-box-containing protein